MRAFLILGEDPDSRETAILTGVYVPREHRGHGYAIRLLSAGIERALELGYSRVELNVYAPRLIRLITRHLKRYHAVLQVNNRGNDMEGLTRQEEEALVEEEPGGSWEVLSRAFCGHSLAQPSTLFNCFPSLHPTRFIVLFGSAVVWTFAPGAVNQRTSPPPLN